jgi:hypothetical protein
MPRGGAGWFCCFWAFLRGVLEKVGAGTWFLRGGIVVDCVVNVVVEQPYLEGRKIRHIFQLFFCRSLFAC